MKYALISLLLLLLITGCKEEKSSENNYGLADNEVSYKGEYIHVGNAAVLTTADEIYAVQIDDMAGELDQQAKEFMRTPYDMVQVIVTGKLIPNPRKVGTGEGWEQMLVIDKIIEVRKAKTSSVMKAPAQEQEDN
ncbi:component of SufBCD complex [Nonlabens antarcticus]|uniref:component of SufBCD complex n=1 Tax=Nonlabens antarcticus TaxID=392714 RepID=UPI001890C3B7|nr:component of SufBCD complex [Nonlabens antarcticus]